MAATPPLSDERPWGRWEIILSAPGYQVKRITVRPGQRLSYQRHARRAEHWYVVRGRGVATLDGKEIPLAPGQALDVPLGAAHRMTCAGQDDLVFIEVQTGDYLGEDDITRLEDDYGRAGNRG